MANDSNETEAQAITLEVFQVFGFAALVYLVVKIFTATEKQDQCMLCLEKVSPSANPPHIWFCDRVDEEIKKQWRTEGTSRPPFEVKKPFTVAPWLRDVEKR